MSYRDAVSRCGSVTDGLPEKSDQSDGEGEQRAQNTAGIFWALSNGKCTHLPRACATTVRTVSSYAKNIRKTARGCTLG